MQTGTELQAPFSYSLLPIILLFVALFLPLIIRLLKKYWPRNNDMVINTYTDSNMIKNKYLNMLDELDNKLDTKKISSRKAYQELSILIRSFVKEVTGIDVTTCVLSDIERMNMPIIYDLVKEYYSPEFARISIGNIRSSISKTRGVIYRWN